MSVVNKDEIRKAKAAKKDQLSSHLQEAREIDSFGIESSTQMIDSIFDCIVFGHEVQKSEEQEQGSATQSRESRATVECQ